MIKCVAIDDEPLALQLISEYVSRIPVLQLINTFEDAISGGEYLRSTAVDLLFIDINMPDISGIELVKSLELKPMIIFTTAYKNFAFEGFELEAVDYLLKPIDFKRFSKAAEKAAEYYYYKNAPKTSEKRGALYVYSEYKMVKINLDDIEYIEGMEDYIKIFIGADKPVLTLMPLKKILEKLPEDDFKRIHRSYIVALSKIKFIHNRKVKLTNAELPVSDSYGTSLKSWAREQL